MISTAMPFRYEFIIRCPRWKVQAVRINVRASKSKSKNRNDHRFESSHASQHLERRVLSYCFISFQKVYVAKFCPRSIPDLRYASSEACREHCLSYNSLLRRKKHRRTAPQITRTNLRPPTMLTRIVRPLIASKTQRNDRGEHRSSSFLFLFPIIYKSRSVLSYRVASVQNETINFILLYGYKHLDSYTLACN